MAKTVELVLNRESVSLRGRKYFNYYVPCEIFGRKSKARIIPKDNGGYALLDILFENEGPVRLIRRTTKNTNSNGTIALINSYTAVFADKENDKVYEVAVKPYKTSDEDWIKMYIETLTTNEPEAEDEAEANNGLDVSDE